MSNSRFSMEASCRQWTRRRGVQTGLERHLPFKKAHGVQRKLVQSVIEHVFRDLMMVLSDKRQSDQVTYDALTDIIYVIQRIKHFRQVTNGRKKQGKTMYSRLLQEGHLADEPYCSLTIGICTKILCRPVQLANKKNSMTRWSQLIKIKFMNWLQIQHDSFKKSGNFNECYFAHYSSSSYS